MNESHTFESDSSDLSGSRNWRNQWFESIPSIVALFVLILAYWSAWSATGRHLLAITLGATLSACMYFLGRLILRRGKLSLSLFAFVLPLIVASLCVGLQQLKPFRDRQMAITQLRNAGMVVRVRPPNRAGEWLQDRSGHFMPTWLMDILGPDSMSEIFAIEGEIARLQVVDYGRVEMARPRLKLFAYSEVTLDAALIDWINTLPGDEYRDIYLQFKRFQSSNAAQLGRIQVPFGLSLSIRSDEDVSLGQVGNADYLTIDSDTLTDKQLSTLTVGTSAKVSAPFQTLTLKVDQISPGGLETIARIKTWDRLELHQTKLTAQHLEILAQSGIPDLVLFNPKLPRELASLKPPDSQSTIWGVRLTQTTRPLNELQALVRLTDCEYFFYSPAQPTGLSTAEARKLFDAPRLKTIQWEEPGFGILYRDEPTP